MSRDGIAEAVKTVTKDVLKPEEPAKYDVIFLNDNITPMEFVIRVLKSIFNKSQEEANKLTMMIHEKEISKSIELNIIGTANIVRACEMFNIKLIYLSTSYVYPGK